jgi:hypothetical protein
MTSLWKTREEVIEGDDTVHGGTRHVQSAGNEFEHFIREIPEDLLGAVEDIDEAAFWGCQLTDVLVECIKLPLELRILSQTVFQVHLHTRSSCRNFSLVYIISLAMMRSSAVSILKKGIIM